MGVTPMSITGTGSLPTDAHTTSNETAVLTEFAIPDNTATILDVTVVARAPSTGAGRRFTTLVIATRFNGGVPVVAQLKTVEIGSATLANAALTFTAGASFSVIAQITGVTGIPMDWAIDGVMRFFP